MLPGQRNRLLVIENGEDGANRPDTLSESLARRGYRVDTAGDAPVAIEKIGRADYDLVLLDSSSLDLLRLLRATHSAAELPVIMVSGANAPNTVREALDDGANDYVVKPLDMPVVTARIEEQLSRGKPRAADSREQTDFEALLERLPRLDTLTLLVLDLDGFRMVNDSFGRSAGDRILAEVARRITAAAENFPGTMVARTEGDEFAVLAPQASGGPLAEKILEAVVRPMLIEDLQISISASIGVFCGAAQSSPEHVLRDAHLAMHRAKELGKNRCHVFHPELRTRARARLAMIHDLRYALERRELRSFYQPRVHLRSRRIVGFEALIRWRHPVRGIVYPGDFIELAEETGLILPIGEWILAEACRQLRQWQTRFPQSPLTMNVNLSVKQLLDPNLVRRVGEIIAESGIAPESLNLELTETALMTNLDEARIAIAGLRDLRVGLKLDDFGTGYSSLGYLHALHFDSLKIDKSFVTRMAADAESRAIVQSVAGLAHALGMTVVAEGVELEQHVEELLALGCEVGQGFHFSPAVEASRAEEMLVTARL